MVDAGHLLGIHEIAEMLRVPRQRADELSQRADFPLPVRRIRSGRAWRRHDIETWARDTGRLE